MNQKIILFLLFSVLGTALFAQSKKYKSRDKNTYWDAQTAYLNLDFKKAIQLYKEIENVDPKFLALYNEIGNSYFYLDEYENAISYLRKGAEDNADSYYKLALIKLYFGELDSADFYINRFEQRYNRDRTEVNDIEKKQLVSNIKNAREFLMNPETVNVINVGSKVNTEFDEYVPLVSSDEELLIFTSKRDLSLLDPYGEPFEDIYMSTNNGEGNEWSQSKLVGGAINTKTHDACVGLSPDGSTLYLFRTNKNVVVGDLYESLNKDGVWTTPIRMSNTINGKESTEPSASISIDGSTLYFSSDREGGYGGFDLYRVKKLPNGEWSLALNLGPTINTPFDEDAPFIHPNNKTLYFSSKGHKNMGGYDVFKSELVERKWSDPVNLGVPTNTTKDDIYFTISANEKHGYYSSEKASGFGGQDIYMIDYLERSLRQSVISAKVLLDGKPVSADVTLFDVEGAELTGSYIPNPANGKFIFLVNPDVEYELIVEGDGFEEHVEVIQYTIEDLSKKQKMVIELKSNK